MLQIHCWRNITSYCDAISLCRACAVSKALKLQCSDDIVWQSLCERRWNVVPKTMRILGLENWQAVFQKLQRRGRIPKGSFTEKRAHIFGRGRAHGVDCWVRLVMNCTLLTTN